MKYFVFGIFFVVMLSCDKNDDPVVTDNCIIETIIDRDLYLNTAMDYFIDSIGIENDCIEITVNASGCDGDTWSAQLIDSGDIAESSPPQRSLRLALENTEECDAVISKSFYFDLSTIQTEESRFILRFEGWDQTVLYEYRD